MKSMIMAAAMLGVTATMAACVDKPKGPTNTILANDTAPSDECTGGGKEPCR